MEYKDMENVTILNHPLIQHKISRLRTATQEPTSFADWLRRLPCWKGMKPCPIFRWRR